MPRSAARRERLPTAHDGSHGSARPCGSESPGRTTAPAGFLGLLCRAQAGDREAMDEILSLLHPQLYRVSRLYGHRLRPAQSADDLLQESCLRAWRNIRTFQPGRHDVDTFRMFRAWMRRIIRNVGINAHRDQTARSRSPAGRLLSLDAAHAATPERQAAAILSSSTPIPGDAVFADELIYEITDALDDLSDGPGEEIVRLRFLEGLSIPAIASRMELTPDKVRHHYEVTLRRLGALLAEWK